MKKFQSIQFIPSILVASTLFVSSSTMVLAGGTPYIGADLGVNTLTSTTGSNARGVPFTIFAGYGSTVNTNLYLAGELFLTPFTANMSSTHGNALKTSYNYGLSVLPGIMFSDHTLGYIRAGVVRTRFTSNSVNKTGAQAGFGLQTDITQDMQLRTEYVFSAYSKTNNQSSPRSDAFNLGLIYKFA